MSKHKHTARAVVFATATLVVGGGLLGGVAAAAGPSINTVAGNGTAGSSGDGGLAVKAELNTPTGVAEDKLGVLGTQGTLYISDSANNKIRKVVMPTTLNKDVITTIAGTGTAGYNGDNVPATSAELKAPTGIALNAQGVFIADTGNNRIRKISPSGTITTYAGTGKCSRYQYGSGLANNVPATQASLCAPSGIALDSAGNLYISDTGHDVVSEVLTTGKIVDFAGTGSLGSSGNGGPATSAKLAGPTGVATDGVGDVYISDTLNSEVRRVHGGTIYAFAGEAGKFGYNGDNIPATSAELSAPTGLGVDPSGDVFISDTGNSRIREVMGATISTYAGTGTPGFSGDGGPANLAKIKIPTGQVASDGANLYFGDTGNQRVRDVTVGPPPVLPQTNLAILLPVSGGLVIVGGSLIMMRRRRLSASAAT